MIGRWLARLRRGRTGLGAAVTGLPTGPLPWTSPPPPPPAAPPAPSTVQAVAPAARVTPVGALEPPGAAATVPPRTALQVVLGFRDGSEAQLDPESAQARALEELALTLAARD